MAKKQDKKIHLLVIDPQNDFCDPNGSLCVPEADKDMARLTTFIAKQGKRFTKIHVTLDSHNEVDIAHPVFWKNQEGKNPEPFTIITLQDVEAGTWKAANPKLQARVKAYVTELYKNKRYPLCIWPPHCLIGSWGTQVVPELRTELGKWANDMFRTINWVAKGTNPFTEHYSPLKADVPDPTDPTTHLNTNLINLLQEADTILLAGEASSHCVANAIRDIATAFNSTTYIKKLVLLEDATSPVPGFETLATDMVTEMKAKGMQVSNTIDWN